MVELTRAPLSLPSHDLGTVLAVKGAHRRQKPPALDCSGPFQEKPLLDKRERGALKTAFIATSDRLGYTGDGAMLSAAKAKTTPVLF